ncbi:MAG: hypothetical protein QOE26_2755 [Verrucomicrobiota bacterium]|jgi:hypothetical protein
MIMPCIVDTSQINGFCRSIAATNNGVTIWDAMIFEIGKVLEGCVRLTMGDHWKITRSVEFKNRTLRFGGKGSGPAIIYISKKGLAWFADEPGAGYEGIAQGPNSKRVFASSGKTFHPMTEFFHYGQPRWGRYQAMLAQLKDKQVPVRHVMGRAAQSWVQMAQSMGLQINAPDWVRNAPAFRGQTHINGFSKSIRSVGGAIVELKNTNPVLLGTIDGNRILQVSIKNRLKYLYRGISETYIAKVKETASRYRGLIAT